MRDRGTPTSHLRTVTYVLPTFPNVRYGYVTLYVTVTLRSVRRYGNGGTYDRPVPYLKRTVPYRLRS